MKKYLLKMGISVFVFSSLTFVILYIFFVVLSNKFWDFSLFYSSAKLAIRGDNIYRVYGSGNFPYWYFPWISWLFIPLALLPFQVAKIIYALIILLCAYYSINKIGNYYDKNISINARFFILTSSLLMCMLLFLAGQVDFILTALIVLIMTLVINKNNVKAGILFPFLLFKPHLLILFFPFLILRGGKKFLLSAVISTLFLCFIAFLFLPHWPADMLRMLIESGSRTDNNWHFMTLAELLGRQENWSGTANLWIVGFTLILSFIILWKNQHLPTIPFLTLTITASMFCAPRAYSYNLPFIIPSLLWLSAKNPYKTIFVWIGVVIISSLSHFSTGSYWIVLLAFAASVIQSYKIKASEYQFEYQE